VSQPGTTAAEVRILGPTTVVRGHRHSVPPPGRPATLLALVATQRSVPIDRVLDLLWPDVDPVRSRPRLRNVLSRLRAEVGPVVERDGELLVLGSDVVVDAHRFEELAEQALQAGPDEVERRIEAALASWTGLPLPAWPYDDWAADERRPLVRRCVALLARRAEVRAAAGAVPAALDDLEHALVIDPDDHELWRRAVELAESDDRAARARSLRRRAAAGGIDLV
jgi:DNA-binding SARP family transcriptional activator